MLAFTVSPSVWIEGRVAHSLYQLGWILLHEALIREEKLAVFCLSTHPPSLFPCPLSVSQPLRYEVRWKEHGSEVRRECFGFVVTIINRSFVMLYLVLLHNAGHYYETILGMLNSLLLVSRTEKHCQALLVCWVEPVKYGTCLPSGCSGLEKEFTLIWATETS